MGGGRKVNDEQHGNTACGLKIHWLSLMERKATCDMMLPVEREKKSDKAWITGRAAWTCRAGTGEGTCSRNGHAPAGT